jgi:hypothetical protein
MIINSAIAVIDGADEFDPTGSMDSSATHQRSLQ